MNEPFIQVCKQAFCSLACYEGKVLVLYLCGAVSEAGGFSSILVDSVEIENGDIFIDDGFGSALGIAAINPAEGSPGCVEVLSLLASNTDRVGQVGLGSEEDVVITLSISEGAGSSIGRVKCIAFVPNSVTTFNCTRVSEPKPFLLYSKVVLQTILTDLPKCRTIPATVFVS